jgi:hypothetical protein
MTELLAIIPSAIITVLVFVAARWIGGWKVGLVLAAITMAVSLVVLLRLFKIPEPQRGKRMKRK